MSTYVFPPVPSKHNIYYYYITKSIKFLYLLIL